MAIQIKTAEDLKRLLATLANELVDANVYLQLHQDLSGSVPQYQREFNQARAFWGLTLQAHLDAAIFRLCKIYDDHRDGLNMKSLLETIRANLHVFSRENFRERMKGNAFVDALAAEARTPDVAQLNEDIAFASKESNPLVNSLVGLRNKLFAHRASREVLSETDLAAVYPLTTADAHQLLACGMEMVNRYSQLFSAEIFSTRMVGHDDFRTVLEALRVDLRRRDEEIEAQRRRYAALASETPDDEIIPADPKVAP